MSHGVLGFCMLHYACDACLCRGSAVGCCSSPSVLLSGHRSQGQIWVNLRTCLITLKGIICQVAAVAITSAQE